MSTTTRTASSPTVPSAVSKTKNQKSPTKSLQTRLEGILQIKKAKTPFALMMRDPTESQFQLVATWNKQLGRKRTGKLTIDEVFSHLTNAPNEEASQLNSAALYPALWGAQHLDQLTPRDDSVSSEELVELLWSIAATAQASNSMTDCGSKSLGIELGITLCLQTTNGSIGDAKKLILENHLQEEFESLVESQLDGDGWPVSAILPCYGPIASSWIRSYLMLSSLSLELDYEIVLLIEWMIRQLMRMRRSDGSLCFGASGVGGTAEFWSMLKHVSDDDDDRTIHRAAVEAREADTMEKRKRRIRQAGKIAESYNLSEWSRSALLRSSWDPHSPMLGIDFSRTRDAVAPNCTIDLNCKHQILAGNTIPSIQIQGTEVEWPSEFEVICDRFDEDLDYLELQTEFCLSAQQDVLGTFSRQFILSRSDQFLLVIDTIIPPEKRVPKTIDYACDWPMSDSVEPLAETETREYYLQSQGKRQKIVSLAIPLSLPEWKSARFSGCWSPVDGALRMEQSQLGSGMIVPVLFDLDTKRSRQKRTWRKLTVAQDRHPVPADHGAAFRFCLNKSQWFFYRAAATTGNRTFLGENTVAEFVFNRFDKDGTVTSLLEVK